MRERIEYYTTLTPEQYLQEPRRERLEALNKVFMKWTENPEWAKSFVEKIIKPLQKERKDKKDLELAQWIKNNKDMVIVRFE